MAASRRILWQSPRWRAPTFEAACSQPSDECGESILFRDKPPPLQRGLVIVGLSSTVWGVLPSTVAASGTGSGSADAKCSLGDRAACRPNARGTRAHTQCRSLPASCRRRGKKEDRGKMPRSKQNGREGRENPFCNDPIGYGLEYFRKAGSGRFSQTCIASHKCLSVAGGQGKAGAWRGDFDGSLIRLTLLLAKV